MYPNYYKILGISPGAEKEDIKKAFRALAKKYHPDMNPNPDANQVFIQITEAYEVLINLKEQAHAFTDQQEHNTNVHDIAWEEKERIRKKAAEHARMKYQKFAQQHEAFQTSGFYDLGLIFKIIGRLILLILTIAFWVAPILLAFIQWQFIFILFFTWTVALFFSKHILEQGKIFFFPGKVYYNFSRLKEHFAQKKNSSYYKCFYCKDKSANAIPYRIYLLKVKGVKVRTGGPLTRQVNYKRTYKTIKIPRSQKALVHHSISSIIKIICVFILPFFLPFGIYWRMAISIYAGLLISNLYMFIFKTASKTAYLLNRSLLYKIIYWNIILLAFSDFSHGIKNLHTHEFMNVAVFIMIMLDPLYEQIAKTKVNKGHYRLRPLFKKYREMDKYFDKQYQYQIDVPIWTVLYPLIKWVFG